MRRYLVIPVLCLVLMLFGLPLMAETLVEIERIRPGDLEVIGFELTREAEVEIEAVGLRKQYGRELAVYAWLLDHETRQPVWVMKDRFTDRHGRNLRQAKKTKVLDQGKYELYFYAGDGWFGNIQIHGAKDFIDFLGDLFGGDDDYDDYNYDEYVRDCYVRISSDEVSRDGIKIFTVTGDLPNALIKHNCLGDSEYIRQGFSLEKPMSLRIYSIIEYPKGYRTPVDNGWIMNAETRQRVWEMDRWNTERAGGGKKNRMFNGEIGLEKGNYILYFSTDDSHSFDGFNVNPPYDPCNWGVTVLPGEDFDRSAFKLVDQTEENEPLIDLTRARDNDYEEQAFRLDKKTTLRIYALGEFSFSDGEFVDYGWIQRAGSGEIEWEMTERNTMHAGGAEKNRMFDGNVTLPAGEYIAAYVTDGSHSYRDWNAARPFDSRAWGLAIYPGPDSKSSTLHKISMHDLMSDSDILVSLTRVRDNERRRDKFTLDKRTTVHIYAIGEGTGREMHDYGWIVDDRTGRAVWEMTWRNTDHAGGARKNKIFDDDITLNAGTYEVYYVTDGSHSFNDWNAARPRDARNWGITVSRAD